MLTHVPAPAFVQRIRAPVSVRSHRSVSRNPAAVFSPVVGSASGDVQTRIPLVWKVKLT